MAIARLFSLLTKNNTVSYYQTPFVMDEHFLILQAVDRNARTGCDAVPTIPTDCIISVGDSSAALVIDNSGLIAAAFAESGEHIHKSPVPRKSIYFINQKQIRNNYFHGSIPAECTMADSSPAFLVVNGFFDFRISAPELFFTTVSGTAAFYKTEALLPDLQRDLQLAIRNASAELKITPSSDPVSIREPLEQKVRSLVSEMWTGYGLTVTRLELSPFCFLPEGTDPFSPGIRRFKLVS